jgi:hypothetical protein
MFTVKCCFRSSRASVRMPIRVPLEASTSIPDALCMNAYSIVNYRWTCKSSGTKIGRAGNLELMAMCRASTTNRIQQPMLLTVGLPETIQHQSCSVSEGLNTIVRQDLSKLNIVRLLSSIAFTSNHLLHGAPHSLHRLPKEALVTMVFHCSSVLLYASLPDQSAVAPPAVDLPRCTK